MLCLLFVLAAPSPLAMEDGAALQPWMDLENKPPIWHICGLHAGPTTSEQAVPTEATNECDAVAEQGTLNVQIQKGGGISKLFGGGDKRREAESRVYTKRCNAFHICRAHFPLDATTTKYYTQDNQGRSYAPFMCRNKDGNKAGVCQMENRGGLFVDKDIVSCKGMHDMVKETSYASAKHHCANYLHMRMREGAHEPVSEEHVNQSVCKPAPEKSLAGGS